MELAVRMGACSDSGTSGEESSDDDGNPGPGQPVQLIPESVIEDLLRRNQQRQANSRNNDQMAGVRSEQRPNAEEEDQPREREPKRRRFD